MKKTCDIGSDIIPSSTPPVDVFEQGGEELQSHETALVLHRAGSTCDTIAQALRTELGAKIQERALQILDEPMDEGRLLLRPIFLEFTDGLARSMEPEGQEWFWFHDLLAKHTIKERIESMEKLANTIGTNSGDFFEGGKLVTDNVYLNTVSVMDGDPPAPVDAILLFPKLLILSAIVDQMYNDTEFSWRTPQDLANALKLDKALKKYSAEIAPAFCVLTLDCVPDSILPCVVQLKDVRDDWSTAVAAYAKKMVLHFTKETWDIAI